MIYQLENEFIQVKIATKGAELQSLLDKQNNIEHIWNADPAYWAKHSPVLFPIVGSLKDKTYYYEGDTYHLERHGFARDKEFNMVEDGSDSLTFSLSSSDDTLAIYPFNFLFKIIYKIDGKSVYVSYRVENIDTREMFFSVGGHPAFRVPMIADESYEDYQLIFNKHETLERWPIKDGGLIGNHPIPFLQNGNAVRLRKDLFAEDALVFKHPLSDNINIVSDKSSVGLKVAFPGFGYLGIWAAPGADFVCVEPWCGIADSIDANQQFVDKEGLQRLSPGHVFERTWSVTIF